MIARGAALAVALSALALACGGKLDPQTDGGATDASPCVTRVGDVGNCFSNIMVATPTACGLTAQPTTITGAACARFCEGTVRTCAWDGKSTLRCEYCR